MKLIIFNWLNPILNYSEWNGYSSSISVNVPDIKKLFTFTLRLQYNFPHQLHMAKDIFLGFAINISFQGCFGFEGKKVAMRESSPHTEKYI